MTEERSGSLSETPPTVPAEEIRRRRSVATLIIAALIVGLPALTLDDPGLAKYGWQMFARTIWAADYEVERSNGSVRDVAAGDIAARLRPDVEYKEAGAAWICDHDDQAVSVVAVLDGEAIGEFRCDS